MTPSPNIPVAIVGDSSNISLKAAMDLASVSNTMETPSSPSDHQDKSSVLDVTNTHTNVAPKPPTREQIERLIQSEWARSRTRGAFGGGKVAPKRQSAYSLAPWQRDGYGSEEAYRDDHRD